MNLRNLVITGDLTINTPNAHVNGVNTLTVDGSTNVQAVSWNSFVSAATHTGGIVVTDSDGATIDLSGNAAGANVTLNTAGPVTLKGSYTGTVTLSNAATVEVASGASVSNLVVESGVTGATVDNSKGGAITNVTANSDIVVTGAQPTTTDGNANVASDADDLDAKQALTAFLKTAKTHNYADLPAVGNYKDLSTLTIDGLNVIIDISADADKIAAIQAKPAVAEGTATGLYVMNTFARYLGALNYKDTGATVKEIKYNGISYTWQQKLGESGGYLKGSNWRKADLTTLVSVITTDVAGLGENDSLTVTLVDGNGKSINVNFAVKTQ